MSTEMQNDAERAVVMAAWAAKKNAHFTTRLHNINSTSVSFMFILELDLILGGLSREELAALREDNFVLRYPSLPNRVFPVTPAISAAAAEAASAVTHLGVFDVTITEYFVHAWLHMNRPAEYWALVGQTDPATVA